MVLAAATTLLAGCEHAAQTPSGDIAGTPAAPGASITAAPVDRTVRDHAAFLSPSFNIGCQIGPTGVRCDIDQRNWSPPPRPADCTLDFGQGISMEVGEPAKFVCAGDTARVLPPYDRAGEPLPYGEAITAGPIRCVSAETGITCRDTGSGHGFSLSRESYSLS